MIAVRLAAPIVLGAVAAMLFEVSITNVGLYPQNYFAAAGLFYILLVLSTWISVRTGWRWWLASLVGAAAGLTLATYVFLLTSPCFGFTAHVDVCPESPLRLAVIYAIATGGPALAQAVLFTGRRAAIWSAGNLLAGAVLGEALLVLSPLTSVPRPLELVLPDAIAGALWGVVVSVLLWLLGRGARLETAVR